MECLSEAEARALDAQCGSPTSTHSRRAVIGIAALSPDEKTLCIANYAIGDLGNLVRCALAAGVSSDTRWCENNTPVLCIAALRGSHRALRSLLAGGANLAQADACGMSAAHFAAFCGHVACLRLLIEAGAQTEAKERDGYTPLHLAAQAGHAEACQLLLAAGASLAASATPSRVTPLPAPAAGAHLDATDAASQIVLELAQARHPANAELLALLSGRGPADAPGTTCNHCGAREADAHLRACSGCYSVRYCGEACSKAAWPAHKEECRRRQAKRKEKTQVQFYS